MKKSLTLIIVFFIICSCFAGCKKSNISSSEQDPTSWISTSDSLDESSENDLSSSEQIDSSSVASTVDNKTGNTLSGVSKPVAPSSQTQPAKPVSAPVTNDTGVSSNGNTTTAGSNVVVENIAVSNDEDNKKLEEIASPTVDTSIVTEDNNHVAISQDSYYQYSTLSSSEKKIYKKIINAIETTQVVVPVDEFNINYDKASCILQKTIADNPQYFWLSKSTSIAYNPTTYRAYNILLYYTDGTKTDEISSEYKLTTSANRDTIKSQISKFGKKVSQIVSSVPVKYSEVEKERVIHDYILKNVTYDYESANKSYGYNDTLPRCFDSYGAICNNLAVCEGYSKMFQYLCYCVGINATQITGVCDGGNHMWNGVEINGKWYQLDTTWDDSFNDGTPYYEYFNFTTAQASKERKIDYSMLSVPNCTSTNDSFDNAFALIVNNAGNGPSNYQKCIDELIKMGDYVILRKNTEVSGDYFSKYIFNSNSDLMQYAHSKGYNISLAKSYRYLGNYAYFTIVK